MMKDGVLYVKPVLVLKYLFEKTSLGLRRALIVNLKVTLLKLFWQLNIPKVNILHLITCMSISLLLATSEACYAFVSLIYTSLQNPAG